MNKLQSAKLISLDINQENGTIQNILLNYDLEKLQLVDALFFILKEELKFKQSILDENKKLVKALQECGKDVNDILFGGTS